MTDADTNSHRRVNRSFRSTRARCSFRLAIFALPFLSGVTVLGAEDGEWALAPPQVKDTSSENTSLHLFNDGQAAVNIQVIWSGGVWSARIPAGGARTVDLENGGRVEYILTAGTESTEGTLDVAPQHLVHWRFKYTGQVEPPPAAVKPLPATSENVRLVLPAAELEGFDQLSTPGKIDLLEKGLDAKYRGNQQVIKALSVLHNNYALDLQKEGNWEQALLHFRRAMQLSPQDDGIRTNLAISQHNRALGFLDSGDFRSAEREIRAALDLAQPLGSDVKATVISAYAEILIQWGVDEEEKGWRDSAARRFRQAIGLDPRSAVAWARLGEIHYARHDLAEAAECFRRAVDILPRKDIQERFNQIEREIDVAADFSTSEVGRFRISFEDGENASIAREVRTLLREAYRDVGRLFRHYPKDEIPVVIYNSGQFGHVTQLKSWAGAAYDGKIRLRVDPQEQSDKKILLAKLKSQINHEYAHAVIHSLAGRGVPGWLHEGLAQYAEDRRPLTDDESALLSAHFRRGSLLSLDQMTGALAAMADAERVSLAYLQSKAFARFLLKQYQMRRIRALLSQMGDGKPFEAAVRSAFGQTLPELDTEWQESLR